VSLLQGLTNKCLGQKMLRAFGAPQFLPKILALAI